MADGGSSTRIFTRSMSSLPRPVEADAAVGPAVAGALAPASSTAGSMVSAAPATMAAGHTRPLWSSRLVVRSADGRERYRHLPLSAGRDDGGIGEHGGKVTGAGKVTAGGFG